MSRAQPDGYTLLVASAAHAVNGGTRKVPCDPLDSFAWIGMPGLGPSVLSVHAALPVNSVRELIAHGKLNLEIARYSKLPETLKRYEAEGVEADPRTPEEVRKMLPLEMAKWANVAKVANIRTQ